MAGIQPEGGVPPQQTLGGLTNPDLAAGCENLWYSIRCNPRFDPVAANFVIAEILNLVNECRPYNCNTNNNMLLAVQCIARRVIFDCLEEELPVAEDACSIEQLVLTTDATGCQRIARYTAAAAQLVAVTSASVYGPDHNVTIPANANDPATYYSFNELSSDVENNTVNTTMLNQQKVFEATFSLPCFTNLEIETLLSPLFEPAANGGEGRAGQLVFRVDGVFELTSAGFIRYSDNFFTNFNSASRSQFTLGLGAGAHTIEAFWVHRTGLSGADQGAPINLTRIGANGSVNNGMFIRTALT
ncbi:hypothetical protein [Synechococcus phage Ssp-JY38]|nr:hypothetical protein [Synechococcus phage Yong-L2-223]